MSGPQMPSVGEPGVALELGDGVLRCRARRCRRPGRRRSRAAPSSALELGDVVAPQHRRAQVEEAVAEPVAGLDQRRPGLGRRRRRRPAGPGAPGTPGRRPRSPGRRRRGCRRRGRGRRAARRRWRSRTASPVAPGPEGEGERPWERLTVRDTARAQTRAVASVRSALEELGELLEQRALALGADEALGRLAVLEDDQRRDAHHVEAPGGRRGCRRR